MYLTMFCSFSSFVMAATSAAARWEGDRVALQTPFEASGPLTQSGYVLTIWALVAAA